MGDRLEILEKGMEQIQFEEKDEFIAVTAINPEDKKEMEEIEEESQTPNEESTRSNVDSAIGDSVRTEPLDDEGGSSETT